MVIKDNRMEDFTTEEDQSHLGFYVGLDIFELIVKLKFTSQNTKKKILFFTQNSTFLYSNVNFKGNVKT